MWRSGIFLAENAPSSCFSYHGLQRRERRGARGGIVKEQLLKKRYNEWLNIPHHAKWGDDRQSPRGGSRPEACGLADLAGGLASPVFVGVGNDLSLEDNKQQRQSESQNG